MHVIYFAAFNLKYYYTSTLRQLASDAPNLFSATLT